MGLEQSLLSRSTKEVVKFYYDWKRSEGYDKWVATGGAIAGIPRLVSKRPLLFLCFVRFVCECTREDAVEWDGGASIG